MATTSVASRRKSFGSAAAGHTFGAAGLLVASAIGVVIAAQRAGLAQRRV